MTGEERARSRLRQIGALTGKAVGRLPSVQRMMGRLESATQGAQRLAGLVRTTAAQMPVTRLVMRRGAGGQESPVATATDGPRSARAFTPEEMAILAHAERIADVHRGRDGPGSLTPDERSIIDRALAILGLSVDPAAGRSRIRRAVRATLSAVGARGSPGPPWQAIARWRQKSDGEYGPSG